MDLGAQTQGAVEFSWNGGTFDGEAAPAGSYMFRAVGHQGDTTQEIPVNSQTRIEGVSWDAALAEIFVEIEDGRSIALSEISHLSN
jgi:flagellar basal-body rod modification protein FlgD